MPTLLISLSTNRYRSLHDFTLSLNPFTILIGRNDSGKSNVLRAARLLLQDEATEDVTAFDFSKVVRDRTRYPRNITIEGVVAGANHLHIRRQIEVPKSGHATSNIGVVVEGSDELRPLTSDEFNCIPSFYYLRPRTGALQEAFDPGKEHNILTLIRDWMPLAIRNEKDLDGFMRRYAQTSDAMTGYLRFFEEKVHPHLRIAFPSDFKVIRLEPLFQGKISRGRLLVRELTHADAPEAHFRLPVEHHGTALVSVIAMILSVTILQEYNRIYLDGKPLIIAVEEPEVHLHPQAQQIFLKYLKWISSQQQIIATTHSPIFVDRTNPSNVVVLRRANLKDEKTAAKEGKEIKAGSTVPLASDYRTNWQAIKDNLGIRLSDALMGGEINLLVEGPTEAVLLPAMAEALAESGEPTIDLGRAFIVHGEGGNLPHVACLLRGTGNPTVVMVDDDKAGRGYATTLLKQEDRVEAVFKPDVRALPTPVGLSGQCEFEDLLDSRMLLMAFNEAFDTVDGFKDLLPIEFHEFESEQLALHSKNKPCTWVATVTSLLDSKGRLPGCKKKSSDECFSKRILAEKAAEYVRAGRLPVPDFCREVIKKVIELLAV